MTEEATPEIPVWVGGSEKWVTGVGKRTTCDDVIYALLCHIKRHRREEEPDVRNYGLYEGWMGVERPLQGRTRILKVWRAWGDNRSAVTFTVRKHRPFTKPHDGQIAEATAVDKVRRRRSHRRTRDKEHRSKSTSRSAKSTTAACQTSPEHKSEEKSSRSKSSELPNSSSVPKPPSTKAKAFHGFVTQVLEQERLIQEQVSRISKLQNEIDNYEKIVDKLTASQDPVGASGQPTSYDYLKDLDQSLVSLSEHDFDDFSNLCDRVLHMDDKLSHQMVTLDNLSSQLHEESMISDSEQSFDRSRSQSSRRLRYPPSALQDEQKFRQEIGTLNSQLERSISLSMQQQDQLRKGVDMITDCDMDMEHKKQCMLRMENELEQRTQELLQQEYLQSLQPPQGFEDGTVAAGNSDFQLTVQDNVPDDKNIPSSNVLDIPPRGSPDCLRTVGGSSTTTITTTTTSTTSDNMYIDPGYHSQTTTTGEPSPDTSPTEKRNSYPWRTEAPPTASKTAPNRTFQGTVVSDVTQARCYTSLGGRSVAGVHVAQGSGGYEYDSNSDTGFGSLHSSDECALETLV